MEDVASNRDPQQSPPTRTSRPNDVRIDRPRVLDTLAVIFDVDGTLVDSVDFHAEAWRQAFAISGFHFALDRIRAEIGKGGDQLMPVFLKPEIIDAYGEKIEKRRAEIFDRDFMHRVRGFPKVRELFQFLIGAGKTIALGSSAKAKDLVRYKEIAGVADLPMVELTSDDVARSKPHPDIFQAALDRIGLPAGSVTVVGDTPYDVEAAAKAGLTTTGVLCGGFPRTSLVAAGAVDIYRDPEDLLQALLRNS